MYKHEGLEENGLAFMEQLRSMLIKNKIGISNLQLANANINKEIKLKEIKLLENEGENKLFKKHIDFLSKRGCLPLWFDKTIQLDTIINFDGRKMTAKQFLELNTFYKND